MKIGICASNVENILLARKVGFEFVEIHCVGSVMNDEKYPPMLELSRTLPENFMYSCNCLIPSELRLTGADVDFDKIRKYAAKCTERLASLGVQMLVFGSSAAKRVPDGFAREDAMEQLAEAMRIFSDEAKKYGQRICIEPLRYCECNIINKFEESVELMKMTDRENVGAHVDYFHHMQNGEPIDLLEDGAKYIIHTHIASPQDRTAPDRDDGADYKIFFDTLRRAGYFDTVSFEGNCEWSESALTKMYEYLREVAGI